MKKMKFWGMILLAVMMMPFAASCGGDDDDNNGGNNGGGSSSSSRIIKITEEEGGTKFESVISYDSQGRVSRIVTTETGNNNSISEMTYQYSNEQITSKYIKESQSYTTNETHTYTLSNGLIVKDIEVQNNMETTTIYSYNGNGYLTSLSQWGDVIASSTKDFVWTNGNLTSMDGREFKYSNTPWNKGMFFYFKGSNMDGYLWSGGYWGNTPKYMPSQDVYKNWTYNYETSNGLVTRITMTVNKTGEKVISSIVWE